MPVVPIGMPIANTDFYIVQVASSDDEDKHALLAKQTQSSSSQGTNGGTVTPRLAGDGEEGELWIGGIGVSLGYLNQPDLTQKVVSLLVVLVILVCLVILVALMVLAVLVILSVGQSSLRLQVYLVALLPYHPPSYPPF